MSCKYEECGRPGRVDNEGACASCAQIRERMRRGVIEGWLPAPDFGPLDIGRPMPTVRLSMGDVNCVGCGALVETVRHLHEETLGDGRRLAFHPLCAEIWAKDSRS